MNHDDHDSNSNNIILQHDLLLSTTELASQFFQLIRYGKFIVPHPQCSHKCTVESNVLLCSAIAPFMDMQ